MSSKLVASIGLKKRKKAGRENFQINNSGFKIKEKKRISQGIKLIKWNKKEGKFP